MVHFKRVSYLHTFEMATQETPTIIQVVYDEKAKSNYRVKVTRGQTHRRLVLLSPRGFKTELENNCGRHGYHYDERVYTASEPAFGSYMDGRGDRTAWEECAGSPLRSILFYMFLYRFGLGSFNCIRPNHGTVRL